jgi:hypothetical protein
MTSCYVLVEYFVLVFLAPVFFKTISAFHGSWTDLLPLDVLMIALITFALSYPVMNNQSHWFTFHWQVSVVGSY